MIVFFSAIFGLKPITPLTFQKDAENGYRRTGGGLPSCQRGNEAKHDPIAVFNVHRQSRSSRLVNKDFMSLRASQTMCM